MDTLELVIYFIASKAQSDGVVITFKFFGSIYQPREPGMRRGGVS